MGTVPLPPLPSASVGGRSAFGLMRTVAVVMLLSCSLAGSILGAEFEYVLTKRTLATSNGTKDQNFWVQYFGTVDPSSTHSSCLDRFLQHAAPDNIGIHFPQSHTT